MTGLFLDGSTVSEKSDYFSINRRHTYDSRKHKTG